MLDACVGMKKPCKYFFLCCSLPSFISTPLYGACFIEVILTHYLSEHNKHHEISVSSTAVARNMCRPQSNTCKIGAYLGIPDTAYNEPDIVAFLSSVF